MCNRRVSVRDVIIGVTRFDRDVKDRVSRKCGRGGNYYVAGTPPIAA